MNKKDYNKHWRKNNPDKIKQYYQNWKKKNPQKRDRKAYQKEWAKQNPEKIKLYGKRWRDKNKEYNSWRQRQYQLKYSYGLTEAEYQELLVSQDFRCGICGTKTPTGKWKVFAVDHCHQTNKVRGLLCNECNRGMGLLKDSVDILQKAIAYLEKN